MKKTNIITSLLMSICLSLCAFAEETPGPNEVFGRIDLGTKTFSTNDPLGASLLTSMTNKVSYAQDGVNFLVESDKINIKKGESTTSLSNLVDNAISIKSIKINNVLQTPTDKTIELTIPSVQGLASEDWVTNTALSGYVKLADIQDGIAFNTMTVEELKINGNNVIAIPVEAFQEAINVMDNSSSDLTAVKAALSTILKAMKNN